MCKDADAKKTVTPTPLCIDSVIYSNTTDIANKFNTYFSQIGEDLANNLPPTPASYLDYLTPPNPDTFQLKPTNPIEILNLLQDLENTSSQGPDNLPSAFIKSIAVFIAHPLSEIINHSYQQAIFPDELEVAKVIPIFKSGNKSDPSNYRPISLLNIFAKIYEKTINSRLQKFSTCHSLLFVDQFGFRKFHSTELALIKLLDTITSALNSKLFVSSIAIDLKKSLRHR